MPEQAKFRCRTTCTGQTNMWNELPEIARTFLEQIHKIRGTLIEFRETLPSGKSGAVVALVDCSGLHDGVYVLKIDALPVDRDDEETLHKLALRDGAFSGKLPAIVLSERTSAHYCLLIKIAGESRIAWRPLVSSLRLFRSAYSKFGTIAWTTDLFTLGPQLPPTTIVADAVGYKLIEPARLAYGELANRSMLPGIDAMPGRKARKISTSGFAEVSS
jgi:hypothetical protein